MSFVYFLTVAEAMLNFLAMSLWLYPPFLNIWHWSRRDFDRVFTNRIVPNKSRNYKGNKSPGVKISLLWFFLIIRVFETGKQGRVLLL